LENRLSDLNVPAASQTSIIDAVIGSAGSAIPGLSDSLVTAQVDVQSAQAIQEASGEAFTDGAQLAAYVAAGFLVVGFLSTFRLGKSSMAVAPAKEEEDVTVAEKKTN